MAQDLLAEKHSLINDTRFRVKALLLMARRVAQNMAQRPRRFNRVIDAVSPPVIAASESELWTTTDNELNWILTAGKVQNLRIAVKRLNGLEVPAGEVFSFWRHIGNPNFGKGYVIGREVREGCIIPTIAGGLCQLSNALYDVALKANFDILERHRHTRVIRGSLAEQDRDATVKWNYVDLRFRSASTFRIEAELTADKLQVRIRSMAQGVAVDQKEAIRISSTLNDCYACGNYQCFKHPTGTRVEREQAVTTYLLNNKWPEFDRYISDTASAKDIFILPARRSRILNTERYKLTLKYPGNSRAVTFTTLRKALLTRLQSGKNVFALMLRYDEMIAKAMAKKIPVHSTHLVISQDLLPFLEQEGVLAGRTYDVLMTRLPMGLLHERLDLAHQKFPQSGTLNDLRAPATLVAAENKALTRSRQIITPHAEIAAIFKHKAIKLDWQYPKAEHRQAMANNHRILFPASALGRKGAYEVRQLALELALTVVITGKAIECADFWNGVTVISAGANVFEDISLVVYPAYVEHQPRALLKAIAAGIPVIATAACGLTRCDNLAIVSTGEYNALKEAVVAQLNRMDAPVELSVNV